MKHVNDKSINTTPLLRPVLGVGRESDLHFKIPLRDWSAFGRRHLLTPPGQSSSELSFSSDTFFSCLQTNKSTKKTHTPQVVTPFFLLRLVHLAFCLFFFCLIPLSVCLISHRPGNYASRLLSVSFLIPKYTPQDSRLGNEVQAGITLGRTSDFQMRNKKRPKKGRLVGGRSMWEGLVDQCLVQDHKPRQAIAPPLFESLCHVGLEFRAGLPTSVHLINS